jgi:biotin carboxyl carrier protein
LPKAVSAGVEAEGAVGTAHLLQHLRLRRRAAPASAPTAAPAATVTAAVSAIVVKVPDIGDFKEVEVIEVMVKVGDTIKVQSLITVESDKASMEIPSTTVW